MSGAVDDRLKRGALALWVRAWPQAVLGLVTFASRIPFLRAGYGQDPDAHRVVNAAHAISRTGSYVASRLPGYPVQEYAVALLDGSGPLPINILSALMSSVATVAFSGCLRASGVRARHALALALAAVPVIYVNSTCAMDYVWAIAFGLLAALGALRQRPWLAGVWLGLAIGSRITSGALLPSLWLLCFARAPALGRGLRTCAQVTCAALLTGALCFAPVVLRYGAKFFTFYESVGGGSIETIARRATLGVWGSTGLLALAFGAVCVLPSARGAMRRLSARQLSCTTLACVSAVALYVIAYLRLPLEAGYLVPVVPFLLWAFALWLHPVPAVVLSGLMLAAPFTDVGRSGLSIGGPVVSDHAQRAALNETVLRTLRALKRAPRPMVLVAGYYAPALESAGLRQGETPHQVRNLLKNAQQLQRLKAAGFDIFYVDGAIEAYQRRVNGLRLRHNGAHALPLDDAAAYP